LEIQVADAFLAAFATGKQLPSRVAATMRKAQKQD
jgi:hypothetical protein